MTLFRPGDGVMGLSANPVRAHSPGSPKLAVVPYERYASNAGGHLADVVVMMSRTNEGGRRPRESIALLIEAGYERVEAMSGDVAMGALCRRSGTLRWPEARFGAT